MHNKTNVCFFTVTASALSVRNVDLRLIFSVIVLLEIKFLR